MTLFQLKSIDTGPTVWTLLCSEHLLALFIIPHENIVRCYRWMQQFCKIFKSRFQAMHIGRCSFRETPGISCNCVDRNHRRFGIRQRSPAERGLGAAAMTALFLVDVAEHRATTSAVLRIALSVWIPSLPSCHFSPPPIEASLLGSFLSFFSPLFAPLSPPPL